MSPDMRDEPIDRVEREEARKCRSCKAVGYPEDTYCARCGILLSPACQSCGTPISHPVAFYCVRCGEKLQERKNASQTRDLQ